MTELATGLKTAIKTNRKQFQINPWLLALRPKTLTAAVVPVLVATALARHEMGNVIWWIMWCAIFSSVFIQIGTNLVNDALDFKKGADTESRVGPQRVTQSGLLSSKQVLVASGFCFAVAFFLGVPLVIQGGWPIVVIGLVSILLAYGYTGGPFPLAYKGLGDLFVILFFGLIAVGGSYFLQTGQFSISSTVAGAQVGFLAAVLIAVNNLRDAPQDVLVSKKTLAVRFGKKFARAEITLLVVAPFLMGIYWAKYGLFSAAVLPVMGFPIARRIVMGIYKNEPGPVYNQFLTMSAFLHLIFGLLLSFAFWFR